MQHSLEAWLDLPPYSLVKAEKRAQFDAYLHRLTTYHYEACLSYQRILQAQMFHPEKNADVECTPFLPARLFKKKKLLSVAESAIDKVMTSSGTGGARSHIFLDRKMSALQSRVLSKIVGDYIGKKRLPLLIIDSRAAIAARDQFSARAAGILGFSLFGSDVVYALDDNMQLDREAVQVFLKKYGHSPFLMFGFTYIVWEYFFQKMTQVSCEINLENGILFHGGGWKKMQEKAVDDQQFKATCYEKTALSHIHNYYGLIEQAGAIFVACEFGHYHCSIFSDILIRNTHFQLCEKNQKGFLQVLSLLPHSYPGHSILTEDEAEWLGEDDCVCGKKGKYFKVYGRMPEAEVRGCSDTIS